MKYLYGNLSIGFHNRVLTFDFDFWGLHCKYSQNDITTELIFCLNQFTCASTQENSLPHLRNKKLLENLLVWEQEPFNKAILQSISQNVYFHCVVCLWDYMQQESFCHEVETWPRGTSLSSHEWAAIFTLNKDIQHSRRQSGLWQKMISVVKGL